MDNPNNAPQKPDSEKKDPVDALKHLQSELKKEEPGRKYVVISALIAFAATFLPWFQYFGFSSANGWNRGGFLTVIGSLGLLALWTLPKLKIELPSFVKNPDLAEKLLTIAMLSGPVYVIINSNFHFSYFGIGLYIALLAGAGAVYFKFKK